MFDEWKGSAHSNAARNPIYKSMRRLAGDDAGAACDRCHAPLTARLAGNSLASQEGVTCEVCHNIKSVEIKRSGAGFELQLEDGVKYGPLCDAEDHYFHKMGCSPLHSEGRFCAACHLYYHRLPGKEPLPVFTSYEDWRDDPAMGGVSCQTCHMPGEKAEVANGHGVRPNVPHHGFMGKRGDLLARALKSTAKVSGRGEKIGVEVKLKNVRAGHPIPSGLPATRVVVRAALLSAGGAVAAREERQYGRVLVDRRGEEVPFFLATRVASDDRIPPRESRRATLELQATEAAEVQIEVLWRPLSPAIAERLDQEAPDDVTLATGSLKLPPRRGDGIWPGLPRKVRLTP